MKRASRLLFVALLAVSFLVLCKAGDATEKADKKKDNGFPAVERGGEHKILQSLVGDWNAKVKYYLTSDKPLESDGVMVRTMVLGGNFLQESFKGEFAGKPFAGIALIGFDYNKDKFMTTWCDSMSTSMRLTRGTYDTRKKTLTSLGEEFEPNTKRMMKVRDVLRIISADEQILEMYAQPDGKEKEFKMMEVHYTRKKPGKS